jgi:simple sugar transport system permease protein
MRSLEKPREPGDTMTKKDGFKDTVSNFLGKNVVPIIVGVFIVLSIPISGLSGTFILQQILIMAGRDLLLILSLLFPIMAGMGLNFGMALGAMAGQIAIILVLNWGVPGVGGLFLTMAVATPMAIFLGWLCGVILNKVKGNEMITSMMLGYAMSGVYEFIGLFVMGTILIPIHDPVIILSMGVGIRNAVDLKVMRMSLDNLIPLKIAGISIPAATYLLIGLVCVFIWWFGKTKLGHDMRAVGQDMTVSENLGMKVERTRVLAVIFSTIFACYGQIIYLQNMGTLSTYTAATTTSMYAIAALLIGGASVVKATIPNAFIGVVLFHLMFLLSPIVGRNLFGSSLIGEYFRVFVSYGVIALALALYAWKRLKERERTRRSLRGEEES